MYLVNEIFYTLQGEGAHTGRAAAFCRFSRCNLWTGREEDRQRATCTFCDTDFVKANLRFSTARELAEALPPQGMVVLTGGEPALQVDEALLHALSDRYVAIETNGTLPLPEGLDWVCVSPKANTKLAVTRGDELKLVYPQPGAWVPSMFEHLDFTHFFLQPMDGPNLVENTDRAVQYCMDHPQWRLSLQTHKQLGIR